MLEVRSTNGGHQEINGLVLLWGGGGRHFQDPIVAQLTFPGVSCDIG